MRIERIAVALFALTLYSQITLFANPGQGWMSRQRSPRGEPRFPCSVVYIRFNGAEAEPVVPTLCFCLSPCRPFLAGVESAMKSASGGIRSGFYEGNDASSSLQNRVTGRLRGIASEHAGSI